MRTLRTVLALTLLSLFGCKAAPPPLAMDAGVEASVEIPGGKLGAGTYTPRQLLPATPGLPGQVIQLGANMFAQWVNSPLGFGNVLTNSFSGTTTITGSYTTLATITTSTMTNALANLQFGGLSGGANTTYVALFIDGVLNNGRWCETANTSAGIGCSSDTYITTAPGSHTFTLQVKVGNGSNPISVNTAANVPFQGAILTLAQVNVSVNGSLAVPGIPNAPPPVASGLWSFVNNGGGPTTATDIQSGISFAIPVSSTVGNGYVMVGSGSPTMSVEVGAQMLNNSLTTNSQTNQYFTGAYMYETSSSKWLSFNYGYAYGFVTSAVQNFLYYVGSNVAGTVVFGPMTTGSLPFERLRLSGSNVIAEASIDRQVWVQYFSTPITTAFTTAPDKVGVSLQPAAGIRGTTTANVFDFATDTTIPMGVGSGGGGGSISPWVLPPGGQPLSLSPTLPLAATFTAVNALGATLADDGVSKTLQVIFPGNRAAGGNSRGYFYQAVPTPPYTYTLGFIPTYGVTGVPLAGLMIGDTTGKIIEFASYWNNGSPSQHFTADKLSNPTTSAGSYKDEIMSVGSTPFYLEIVDHGVGFNLDFDYSIDGKVYLPFISEPRSDFLGTIDKIGILGDDLSGTASTVNLHMTVFDYTAQ